MKIHHGQNYYKHFHVNYYLCYYTVCKVNRFTPLMIYFSVKKQFFKLSVVKNNFRKGTGLEYGIRMAVVFQQKRFFFF